MTEVVEDTKLNSSEVFINTDIEQPSADPVIPSKSLNMPFKNFYQIFC